MPSDRTLVVIATYNEIQTLPKLVDEVQYHLPQADILIIDDNSPDGTGQWCARQSSTNPRFHCIQREGKLGLGTALLAGMQYAIDKGYTYAITMDADFSHAPEFLPQLIAGMEPPSAPAIDVMIGSRYIYGGSIEGWPLTRHLMSRGINTYSRWFLGLPTRDCSSGLRCYRTALLSRLNFSRIRSHGYSFEEEVLWRLKRLGARFGETPIRFVNRSQGRSKINLRETARASASVLLLALENLFPGNPHRP